MAKSLEFVRDDARSKAAAQRDQLLGAHLVLQHVVWLATWREEPYRNPLENTKGKCGKSPCKNMRELKHPIEIWLGWILPNSSGNIKKGVIYPGPIYTFSKSRQKSHVSMLNFQRSSLVLCTVDQQESCSYKALILALFLNNFLPKTACLWIYHDIVYIEFSWYFVYDSFWNQVDQWK